MDLISATVEDSHWDTRIERRHHKAIWRLVSSIQNVIELVQRHATGPGNPTIVMPLQQLPQTNACQCTGGYQCRSKLQPFRGLILAPVPYQAQFAVLEFVMTYLSDRLRSRIKC